VPIRFRCERVNSKFCSPEGTRTDARPLEIRFDPLLGTTSRIAQGVKLQIADNDTLAAFQMAQGNCPFCPDRVEQITPRIVPEISSEPRVRVGQTVLFPNLVPYSQYAAVAVFSPKHWLNLAEFSPVVISDNLKAAISYIRAVYAHDSGARFCSWNINYLYPSGGSLPHPHSQVFLDPFPTTMLRFQLEAGQRYWEENHASYWEDLVSEERQRKERFLWEIGATAWITAFAPIGFNEVRAVVQERETLLQMDDADVENLALGVSRVLRWYDALSYNSFNLTLYSGPLDGGSSFRVNLVMVTRTAMIPYYRSDSMHLERLHWEAAVDRAPETLAADLREQKN
jgi:UDPglucose--hexose-1-phosphate uridylyltransferase